MKTSKPNWNIAFEISPILAASGSFGDKSGVYRINYNLIVSLSEYLNKHKLSQQIYLYSLAPHLSYSKNLDFSQLVALNNVHFIDAPFQVRPTLVDKESLDIPILRFFVKYIDNFIYYPLLERFLFAQYVAKIGKELRRHHVKILHHSESGHIYMKNFINIIHVNDLVPIKFPFWMTNETIDIHKRKLRFARKYCQGIICISKNTQKDLIDYHKLTTSNLKLPDTAVIYLGGTKKQISSFKIPDFSSIQKLVLSKTGSLLHDNRYFIFFGTIEPRKNLISLVSVFSMLRQQGILQNFKLVMVGGRGWGKAYSAIKNFIEEHYPGKDDSPLILMDFIGDEYLQSLIKHAYATVYPSHYEGFGLPILESMEYGTPVITSNTSSMPEVGGEACLYVNPSEPTSISQALLRLSNDLDLHADLSVKSLKQAAKFSWDKSAKETYQFYSSLIEKNRAASSR